MGILKALESAFHIVAAAAAIWAGAKLIGDYAKKGGIQLKKFFGIKPKLPRAKIRAALREQWLNLEPDEGDIPGVEYEEEIYYETPK